MGYSQDQINDWIEKYKTGLSFRKLSEHFSVPYSTIAWYVRKSGSIDGRRCGAPSQFAGLSSEEIIKIKSEKYKTKPCNICGIIGDERYPYCLFRCKKCVKEKVKQYKNKNNIKVKTRIKRYYSKPEIKRHRRNQGLIRQYGITVEQYEKMLKDQRGVCAICTQPAKGGIKANSCLNVDHDHVTGKVRELLCLNCNRLLGSARDDLAILEKAIVYLKKHQS